MMGEVFYFSCSDSKISNIFFYLWKELNLNDDLHSLVEVSIHIIIDVHVLI